MRKCAGEARIHQCPPTGLESETGEYVGSQQCDCVSQAELRELKLNWFSVGRKRHLFDGSLQLHVF